MKRRRTIAGVAGFVVLSGLLTSVVLDTLLNSDSNAQAGYSAVFSDATGLQPGDSVTIAGLQVGKVSGLSLDNGDALVHFSVNTSEHLTMSTTATIRYANLLGERMLALLPGQPGAAPMRPGTRMGLSRTAPGLDLTEVFDGFQPLFQALAPQQVNELTGSIIDVFQGQGGTVDSLLKETATITGNLAQNATIVDEVLDNLSQLLGTVGSSNSQLGALVDGFTRLVQGLASSRGALGSTIDNLGALTTNLGSLLQKANPTLTPDLTQLASTAGTLAADQDNVDALLQALPAAIEAPTRALSSGTFIDAYLCNLNINVLPNNGTEAGPLNISVIPGVPAPEYPDPIYLPAHISAGDPTLHSAVCQ